MVAHREKDEFAILHDADEGEPRVEVHAELEDIFAQPPDADAAVGVRISPRLLHRADRLADFFALRFRERLDLRGQPVGDSNLERGLRCRR